MDSPELKAAKEALTRIADGAGRLTAGEAMMILRALSSPHEANGDADMESMKVSLGCCLALMAQSGDERCMEMARRIPFTMKNGEPYALVTK